MCGYVGDVWVSALVSILDGKHCNWKKLAGHELFFSDHFDPETAAILKSGNLPIFEGIAPTVFDQEQEYYICVKCGKVYWEGGHHERAMKNFSDLWFNQDQN
ncbi:uncharacterized protein LOC134844940 [Symsagittifera roscoffensis]|uniref:uncharacterized protein LOC134844940 n=1 Tax=Symsagittifera roscoffensis TaxID=84072 RepID=UPI00307BBDCE